MRWPSPHRIGVSRNWASPANNCAIGLVLLSVCCAAKKVIYPLAARYRTPLRERLRVCAPFCALQAAKIAVPSGSIISERCLSLTASQTGDYGPLYCSAGRSRGSAAGSWRSRMVAIESGMWRWVRMGRAPGSVTFGNGRLFEARGGRSS
jgi:hypothetical protein